MSERSPLRLNLIAQRGDGTSIHLDVTINEHGDVVLEGQDVGPAAREFIGDDDYEYWITVPAAEKDRLVLHLIQAQFRTLTAGGDFMSWLRERGIKYTFDSF